MHRSPGFITSNLIGKRLEDGAMIKEYEASHGTRLVRKAWRARVRAVEASAAWLSSQPDFSREGEFASLRGAAATVSRP